MLVSANDDARAAVCFVDTPKFWADDWGVGIEPTQLAASYLNGSRVLHALTSGDTMSGSEQRGPRIEPGTRSELGLLNTTLAWLAGRHLGTPKLPNFAATFGKHRKLFRWWFMMGQALLPNGQLPVEDREVVILRVAHLTKSAYEWQHHLRIGNKVGLSDEVIAGLGAEPAITTSPWHEVLVEAVDSLVERRTLSDEHWKALRARYDEAQMIEFCFLVGHYQTFAMVIQTLGLRLDFA